MESGGFWQAHPPNFGVHRATNGLDLCSTCAKVAHMTAFKITHEGQRMVLREIA